MMDILIVGDSWAADFTVKYKDQKGWSNMLANKYQVTNKAQAGVGQYKILKQLESVPIHAFDVVISSFTTPYRVNTIEHPVHSQDVLHGHCDLLAADCEAHLANDKNNIGLQSAMGYFEYHFDLDYYETVHDLLIDTCYRVIGDTVHLEIGKLDYNGKTFYEVTQSYKGTMNHMSEDGNTLIVDTIESALTNLT